MIRHTETGHASTTDAASSDQEVLKVEVGEAVVPSGINGASVDVLVIGVRDPGVVTSRRGTALVVGSRSTKGVGTSSRHDRRWLVWLVKLSNQAGLIGETTANPLLLI